MSCETREISPSEDAGVPLSEERLQKIEQRANTATAGPWVVGTDEPCENCGHWHAAEARWDHEVGDYGATLSRWHPEIDGCGNGGKQADAAFIAHAREDVPALLAEVRRLRALASVSPVPAPTPEAVQEAVAWLERCEETWDAITPPILESDVYAAHARTLIDYLATPQPPREGEIHPDTARLDTAQRLFIGCDFAWGYPERPLSVVVLDVPPGVGVGADFRAFLDAATAEGQTHA